MCVWGDSICEINLYMTHLFCRQYLFWSLAFDNKQIVNNLREKSTKLLFKTALDKITRNLIKSPPPPSQSHVSCQQNSVVMEQHYPATLNLYETLSQVEEALVSCH